MTGEARLRALARFFRENDWVPDRTPGVSGHVPWDEWEREQSEAMAAELLAALPALSAPAGLDALALVREIRLAVANLPEWTGHPAAGVQRVAVDEAIGSIVAAALDAGRED